MKMRKLIILLLVFILEACAVHKQEPLNAYDMEDYTLTCQYGFNFNPDLFNSDGRLFLASGDVNEYAPDISALMLISGQDDKTLNTMQDLLNKLPPNKREELLKKMVFYRDIFWIQSLEEENMSMEGYSMEEFQSVLNKDEYFILLLNHKKHEELTAKEKSYLLTYYRTYLKEKINEERLKKMLGKYYGKLYK